MLGALAVGEQEVEDYMASSCMTRRTWCWEEQYSLSESPCVSRTSFTSVRAGITGAGGAIGTVGGGTNTGTCTKDTTGP